MVVDTLHRTVELINRVRSTTVITSWEIYIQEIIKLLDLSWNFIRDKNTTDVYQSTINLLKCLAKLWSLSVSANSHLCQNLCIRIVAKAFQDEPHECDLGKGL